MDIREVIRVVSCWFLTVVGLSAWIGAQSAPLTLSNSPLFLGVSVDPNVFFMLDDSGSMDWEILTRSHQYYTNYWQNAGVATVTDGMWNIVSTTGTCGSTSRKAYGYIYSNSDNAYSACIFPVALSHTQALQRDWRVRSSDFNLIYYDPAQTYQPWPGMPDATFTAARSNPQVGSAGYAVTTDLTNFVYEVFIDDHGYTGVRPTGPTSSTDTANGVVDLFDSHITYTVGAASTTRRLLTTTSAAGMDALGINCTLAHAQAATPYASCFGTTSSSTTIAAADVDEYGRTLAETKQNIANWYQYSRRRSFVAKGAIAAVITASPGFRFGLSVINESATLFVEVPPAATDIYATHNSNLLDDLYAFQWPPQGTPLRTGLELAGRYYDNVLGRTDPIVSACQQNFTVLFTDGYWSGANPATAIGNADGDSYSRTLADVARYYYNRDLNPYPDQVPTSLLDGNNRQHMVTFTVAFGVTGVLVDTDNDGWPNPALNVNSNWGNSVFNSNTSISDLAKIDDLWHSAFNSSGVFVAAQTPQEVVDSIQEALANIADRVGSSASVATNSGTLSADSFLFQARFDSADWSGQLLAFAINEDGSVNPVPAWNASDVLDAQNYDSGREIISYNPLADVILGGTPEGQGVAFRWPTDYTAAAALTELSTPQIDNLLTNAPYSAGTAVPAEVTANQAYGAAITDYLRGQRTNEGVGYEFRTRNSVLGDVVNSDPRYVGAPVYRYPESIATKSYAAFKAAYDTREPMVYVGANDGMLHGFAEADGVERIAYVPSEVYSNLASLAQPAYSHRYFVDSGPNIVDAYLATMDDPASLDDGLWRSVLVGGLGGGGQAIFALDVTDPANFDEVNAASLVLWEFDDSDDADLGFTYGKPQITKMANGRWAAVFGNGYNNSAADGAASATGRAVLFIVDLETGALISKLDTNTGSAATPNGLATPAVIDYDGDYVADYIYAGDLLGNMWKFDVTDADPVQWASDYSSGVNPEPLFTTSASQPITTQPQVTFHPDGLDGFMVYFGTGQYLEVDDNDPFSQPTQAFYGIWDKNESSLTAFDSTDLVTQTINDQYQQAFDTDEDGVDDTSYWLRDMSDNDVNYAGDMGWKINLQPTLVEGAANANNFGERQVSNAVVRDGRVIFTTLIPSQQPCDFGGSSFVMQVNYQDGGALNFPAFDLNGDGVFDEIDTNASGRMSDVGIVPTLSILSDTDRDAAFGSGSSGDVDVLELNIGSAATGRQSWRQLD
ncbi:MAG: PilC/PilY family type IV pilus protein [Gammaproteobacteria bacterium]|nr:PilC/PilY family type IV pilus protein [Gammaproteobacteria bacterium]